jgi:uncharacterized protein YndB with AHSA1/START domain
MVILALVPTTVCALMHKGSSHGKHSMASFRTSRDIPSSPEQVFAAFTDPQRLARWWGPAGFTNTFTVCEFTPGGKWSYTMHGPNGGDYPNESVFEEVEPAAKVVIRHVSKPNYRLVITLTPSAGGTTVSWDQAFDDADVARRIEHIVVPANEQNLDRLSAEVLSVKG